MGAIKLDGVAGLTDTLVPNRFLDYYMPNANGEFVKIYLYLLRALSSPDCDVSICHIADIFNHTEKDVVRALKYWENSGLIDLCFDTDKSLTGITLKPIAAEYTVNDDTSIEMHHSDTELNSISKSDDNTTKTANNTGNRQSDTPSSDNLNIANPSDYVSSENDIDVSYITNNGTINASYENQYTSAKADAATTVRAESVDKHMKHAYSTNEITMFKSKSEVTEFLYLAEKYIGKTLSGTDVNSLLYIYDVLEFEPDLIEYLVEYCVTNGHRNLRYIEKVALSWSEEGINTVELAKANTTLYSKSCYPVLKAFGLSGRNPGEGEKAMIVKWTNSYGFDMDIILDACNRTINTIHQPSFEYADSILSKWKEKGIHTLSDIKALDAEHSKKKTEHAGAYNSSKNSTAAKSKNSFNDFEQRDYDYKQLEKKLLGNL